MFDGWWRLPFKTFANKLLFSFSHNFFDTNTNYASNVGIISFVCFPLSVFLTATVGFIVVCSQHTRASIHYFSSKHSLQNKGVKGLFILYLLHKTLQQHEDFTRPSEDTTFSLCTAAVCLKPVFVCFCLLTWQRQGVTDTDVWLLWRPHQV